MFRPLVNATCKLWSATTINATKLPLSVAATRHMSHGPVETDQEFDDRYIAYLSQPDIDGWMVRKAINDLHAYDMVPEPKIIIAGLHACRRVNEFSLAVRFIESVKDQCFPKSIWPYIMQEIGPTMKELGIPTLEELNYDTPEKYQLAIQDV